MTCRIAAKEYTFERFTEVEVADFDQEQIAIFAQNWFRLSDPVKAELFIQNLKENEPLQELAKSPLLLMLLCLVFQEKVDFPKKHSKLYQEGIELLLKQWDMKRGIDRATVRTILNRQRWNAGFSIITEANTNGGMRVSASASKNVRSIDRDYIYKNLALKKKQDLLSQIALATFEQQNYFFEPEAIEELIENFFYSNTPDIF